MTSRPDRSDRTRRRRPERASRVETGSTRGREAGSARETSSARGRGSEDDNRVGGSSRAAGTGATEKDDPADDGGQTGRAKSIKEAERRRVRRSRRRAVVIALAVVVVLVASFVAVYLTPLLSVRTIDVVGASAVTEEEVLSQLSIPQGQPLVRVDTGSAARRVAGIAELASARVQRVYPSTIRVTVAERIPVVFVDEPDGTHLLDETGVDFAVGPPPPGVVRLVTGSPSSEDPTTKNALAVLTSTPPVIRGQIGEVRASSISDVSLLLLDGRTVVWGSADDAERKGAVTLALLSQPGQVLDVSSPDLPTTK